MEARLVTVMFGIAVIPTVDFRTVTECGELVWPIIGYAMVRETGPFHAVHKRWNTNGKVVTSESPPIDAGAMG